MTDFATLLQQGNSWLFVPSAILLGALHGLEPGHSKTMMAAFIIAVRGTVGQAVLLALAATLSHTAIVWAIALGGMYFGQSWNAEANEPWLQLASGLMIVAVALWMIGRTWSHRRGAAQPHDHHHDHGHDHHHHGHHHHHEPLPAACHHDHHHPVHSEIGDELNAPGVGYQDPHERAHAADIRRRFAGREVTTGQIVIFGLTGGLIPCPASITVLLLCLQLKKIVLGAALVLSFSIGLALTMVLSGVLAALSVRHLSKRWTGFGDIAAKAPYLSGALILLVGCAVGWQGLRALV